jgi:uncharacterized protein YbjT (DUF2867 family)
LHTDSDRILRKAVIVLIEDNKEPIAMDEKRTYAITAATGRIGGHVARGLLEAGHEVRALGRDSGRLEALVRLGATACVGDVRDASFVERAFRGAHAALLLVPPNRSAPDFRRYFGDVGANYATALQNAGVRSAVFISSLGAHDEKYRGLVIVHRDVEQSLNEVADLNIVHLRAPTFFENMFYFLPAILARGTLASPIAPDAPMQSAAVRDVAAVALQLLETLEFRGRGARELHGPERFTMRTLADLIEGQLGRPFKVEQIPRDANIEALMAAGASRDFATLMSDTWDTFNRYGLLRATEPTAATMTPTRVEDFIENQLVPAIVGNSRTAERGEGAHPANVG